MSAKQKVELVWNKGIASLCDRRIPDEFPDGTNYVPVTTCAGAMYSNRLPDNLIMKPSDHFNIRDGELVWVRLSWLKSFVKQVLPHVKSRFVLITGDSDSSVPSGLMHEARTILQSPKIVHWYTQNFDGSVANEKISPIPIGIDYHSLSEKAMWGEKVGSPFEQEQRLKSISKSLPPAAKRIPEIYLDFAWQKGLGLRHYLRYQTSKGRRFRESRRRIAYKLSGNELVFSQQTPLPRSEMWRQRGEYAFVLSPHGVGLDCHRTWEALALGHIVLVTSSSIDNLFSSLPVITVTSWKDITYDNIMKWKAHYQHTIFCHEALTSAYWVHKMRMMAKET